MKGFFTKKDTAQTRKIRDSQALLHKTKDPCEVCGLYKKCESPKMVYTGKGKLKILILAEAPGREEDEDWEKLGYKEPTQLIGKAGRLLRKKCTDLSIDIDEDCWKLNVLNCRPPKNRKPTKKELKCCKIYIDKTIQELKPKFIWLLGGAATESFWMGRFSNLSITRWRGLCIPDRDTNAWVLPMFHPSYLLRNETDKNLSSTFDRDLKWAVDQLKRTPPVFEDFENQTTLLYEADDVVRFLKQIITDKPLIAYDYETSALKPYMEAVWVDRHKVWTISVNGISFPYDYPHWSKGAHRQIEKLWQRIMGNPKIKKVAHNLKFEDMWTREIFGVVPAGWVACTMNSAHIIDDRKYFTGLKFQSYIHYGMYDYAKEIKKYITTKPGSHFNTLDKAPLEKVLQYNALDSLLTLKLYHDQQALFKSMDDDRPKANKFFADGLLAFANTQHHGICADKNYYLEQDKILDKKIKQIEIRLLSGKAAQLFKEHTGTPLTIANDVSIKDLRTLLFDIMKLTPSGYTTKGNLPSVDHDALTKINTPFTKKIIERRRLVKTKGTYLGQFIREIVNGKIHPFFDLHIPRSYRSSSSGPNLQNIPTREEEAKKICRSGIKPSPGNKLGFFDYSAIEVRIAACFTKDPALIKYIVDGTDPHKDQAMYLFQLDDKQVTSDIRFYAKNCFVFPEFYGSWYKACAGNLAENCFELETNDKISVVAHLANKGIRRYEDFEDHVKNVEKGFWNKFHVYRSWKDKVISDYQKKGYIDMFFGHRRGGYLTNNMILNTPIQGTAFHCLLWSYIQLDKIFEEIRTKLVGQIHDELLEDINPSEEKEVISITKDIMCNKIREEHDWIIVPLDVDSEFTEIDGNWYDIIKK